MGMQDNLTAVHMLINMSEKDRTDFYKSQEGQELIKHLRGTPHYDAWLAKFKAAQERRAWQNAMSPLIPSASPSDINIVASCKAVQLILGLGFLLSRNLAKSLALAILFPSILVPILVTSFPTTASAIAVAIFIALYFLQSLALSIKSPSVKIVGHFVTLRI